MTPLIRIAMEDLKNMSHTALVNLLAKKTVAYTQMLAGNIKTEEFYECKHLIGQLTAEIDLRKRTNSVPANSNRKLMFR
jgi:hypothetical protein